MCRHCGLSFGIVAPPVDALRGVTVFAPVFESTVSDPNAGRNGWFMARMTADHNDPECWHGAPDSYKCGSGLLEIRFWSEPRGLWISVAATEPPRPPTTREAVVRAACPTEDQRRTWRTYWDQAAMTGTATTPVVWDRRWADADHDSCPLPEIDPD